MHTDRTIFRLSGAEKNNQTGSPLDAAKAYDDHVIVTGLKVKHLDKILLNRLRH